MGGKSTTNVSKTMHCVWMFFWTDHLCVLYATIISMYFGHCYKPPIDSGQIISSFGSHEASVKALSLHYNGQLLLVVTLLDSVLWDVHSCRMVKTLSGGETVGVQNVSQLGY